ncbi:carboxylating nicotinate-nucleotide diphosphorylase [Ruficoccus amylovorans]|uniref:nicotinate-nucleotide diphosphorylase (carboxylating) n=1 Tax=Ruficoccus amylovorans TaxID=1804625 RepID=A0A842HIW5_9BACT|nr:carboxylating nicotinate-nucleotide diphosphorylase [Ruficoccus amylovorans]MBC2596309.1 carboxylating nicotinate-nucleotide diphosphorylase [Ruficoccus amylovorans]
MSKPQRHAGHLLRRLSWDELDPAWLRRLVEMARDEDLGGAGLRKPDCPGGDATTDLLAADARGTVELVAREPMRLCGLRLVPVILEVYGGGCEWSPLTADGTPLDEGGLIGRISGPVGTILRAERVMLNFLQRLSGIATTTAHYVTLLGQSGPRLLDTRKTTPGFRMLEKYAVATGGGWNHRLGLFDRIMFKDNHLAASDATVGERLAATVRAARERRPDLAVEVEVDHLEQIPPVLEAGADVILLDNFTTAGLREAVALIGDKAWTEASGGINEANAKSLASLGLDFVSSGAVVHRSRWMDIGLDWSSHG